MPSADFTIAEFLAWVRTKPAHEAYSFYDASCCALAQFGSATGREYLIDAGDIDGIVSDDLVTALASGNMEDWTFGWLAEQLESILPAEPLPDTWTRADAYLTDIEDVARERVSA